MEPQRQHKMKVTICTVILRTQPMLCSNISATKRVITHVTIKSLAGIPANNYAVMKSVKILTVEGGVLTSNCSGLFFFLCDCLTSEIKFPPCEWNNHTTAFSADTAPKRQISEPWGDAVPPQRHTRSPLLFTTEWKAFSPVRHNESHVHGWNCKLPLTMTMCVCSPPPPL